MASYKEIKKGNWEVYISLGYVDGKKKSLKKRGFKTKTDAKKYVNEVEKDYLNNNSTSSDMILNDYIYKWFNDNKKHSLNSINTINGYISKIDNHITPLIGSYKLSELKNDIIQDFYNKLINGDDSLKRKPIAPQSAKKVMEVLNGCLKYAYKSRLINYLPTDIEKVKSDKPIIKYWSKDEIEFYLEKIKGTYLHTPVLICLLTGIRVGELCGLKWSDFKDNYLDINKQVIQDKKSKLLILTDDLKSFNSKRCIYMPRVLKDHLMAIKEEINPNYNDFIVPNRLGTMATPKNISEDFKNNVLIYNELTPITIHSLRHTHATLLIHNGVNIKVVSDRLGHKNINITLETYVHVMDDMRKESAEMLDKIFK